ncbi:MAG: hypothetical protein KC731_37315 [Myxococcales bacterium]|nr:hypothetical protein [Myxococcales bacterium]
MAAPDVPPVKDPDAAHPVATAWRPLLSEVVRALADGDLQLQRGIAGADAVSAETADHIRRYLRDYGATLTELPEAAWETSVAQWMGDCWDVIVDLWTKEEGPSDLVLAGQMRDVDGNSRFSIHMVYVP